MPWMPGRQGLAQEVTKSVETGGLQDAEAWEGKSASYLTSMINAGPLLEALVEKHIVLVLSSAGGSDEDLLLILPD